MTLKNPDRTEAAIAVLVLALALALGGLYLVGRYLIFVVLSVF